MQRQVGAHTHAWTQAGSTQTSARQVGTQTRTWTQAGSGQAGARTQVGRGVRRLIGALTR
ncbi:hypothetical protein E2562_033789 [Oryza meyeriana var. granulata]|uniref:Uncharacterized protein n=1 Tax=Oryza meyeriana var. granulata TaxID=110450 RepID=A0A6G1C057_9ORYZ|nr:hypothetical protein E2562_033789 [Oryza meyeriana var. granulata]